MLEESNDSSEFRNIQGLVASYKFGQKMPNPIEMCPKYFPCQSQNSNYYNTESRNQYETTAHLCPGTKIGCALCGLYLPNTCGVVCPIAGFYCGKSLTYVVSTNAVSTFAIYIGFALCQCNV